MKLKESKYYNKDFLGQNIYDTTSDNNEILTVQEFFGINNNQKKYRIRKKYKDYKLKVFDNYYELDCQRHDPYLYLIFNKPVHITGEYCSKIIAPEIVIKSDENDFLSYCVANKVLIHNSYKNYCEISYSKIKNINFHNERVGFHYSEVDNFFILNKELIFNNSSFFLKHHKIKCFGKCDDLKKKILTSERFEKGIIHIE